MRSPTLLAGFSPVTVTSLSSCSLSDTVGCAARPAEPGASAAPATSKAGAIALPADNLERLVERDLALHRHLVGGHAALEEVGHFLHVLQFHELERVLSAVHRREAELRETLVGHVFEILAHLDAGHAHHAAGKHV